MKPHFVNLWILSLLWLVPLIGAWWFFIARRQESRMQSFMSTLMQSKLKPGNSGVRFLWQSGLTAAAMVLLLVALARPQWGMKEQTVYQRGRNLIIALDVSRSMLAADVHPNRLERAKADIMDLIGELSGDRAALIAFRHKASLLCPLTTDYAYLRESLDAIDIGSAPAGPTDIGDAIIKALAAFENNDSAHKAIILISDGEDLAENAVAAATQAKERGIPIFTVGIGSRRGSKIPNADGRTRFIQYDGIDVISKLNDQALDTIARTSGGAYISIATASTATTTLGELYRELQERVGVQDLEESLIRRRVERYQGFLLPAVLALITSAFLSRGRLRHQASSVNSSNVPPRPPEDALAATRDITPPRQDARAISILLAISLSALHCFAQTNPPVSSGPDSEDDTAAITPPGRTGARIAQKLYMLGRYEDAAETYLEAARGSTRKSQLDFKYNAALALIAARKHKAAVQILRSLLAATRDDMPDAHMGIGFSLYKAATKEDATDADALSASLDLMANSADAFREAARANAGDNAQNNLATVLSELPALNEKAHIARLLADNEQSDAFQLSQTMLTAQREILDSLSVTLTNSSPAIITEMEALAERQKQNAYLWIPLKRKLLQATSQQMSQDGSQQNLADVDRAIEATRDLMLGAASELRDMSASAYGAAANAERAVYHAWKAIAPYGALLREDMQRQTNSITSSAPTHTMADQQEALELSKLFLDRFNQTPDTPGADASPPGTNSTSGAISPEDRQKIVDLSDQVIATQEDAIAFHRKGDIDKAIIAGKDAYGILLEIEKLLPKDSSGAPDKQSQQDKDDPDESEDQKKDQEQQETDTPQQNDPSENEEKKEEETGEDEPLPENIQKLLDKALEREKVHEAEKRKRMSILRSPHARDW